MKLFLPGCGLRAVCGLSVFGSMLMVLTSTCVTAHTTTSPKSISTPAAPTGIVEKCDCRTMFDNLVAKIEADYVGYALGVRGKRDAEYRRYAEAVRKRAQSTPSDKCIFILREFVRFFRDGHMFVNEVPQLTDEDVSRLTNAAEKIPRDEKHIRRYLDANAKHLDAIEGIWYERSGYHVGIVRDYKPGRRDFVEIMLSEGVQRWTPGQVKAEFRKLPDGSYDVVLYSGWHYPLHPSVYLRGQKGGGCDSTRDSLTHASGNMGQGLPAETE
jgi:hypothetical protein